MADHADCNSGSGAVEDQKDKWDDLEEYCILLGTSPQQECFPLAYRQAFEVVERDPIISVINCQSK